MSTPLEFLTCRLHARRSGMAEGEKLEALSEVRILKELADTIDPGAGILASAPFQQRLAGRFVRELEALSRQLAGADRQFVEWALLRFQFDNLKTLWRGWRAQIPSSEIEPLLVDLPPRLRLEGSLFASPEAIKSFAARFPSREWRHLLVRFAAAQDDPSAEFAVEAMLDRGYFEEYLARASRLSPKERELSDPIIIQEVDLFHLQLVARGRFLSHLGADDLVGFHVGGTAISRDRFVAMLREPDLHAAARWLVGRVVDQLPNNPPGSAGAEVGLPGDLERLARSRLARLANRAFRQSHLGMGAIVGYVVLRRCEIAHLTLLAEGIRWGVSPDELRIRSVRREEA